MTLNIEAIETKLAAARTKLILDKPFLGALVLRLPLKAAKDEWCPTTATDARHFYYNPKYINDLSLAQTQFMLAHEALHCALSHFSRRQHRVKHRWDMACDFAINPILQDEGLTPPPNAVIINEYLGMTAEEIYPLLKDNDNTETLDKHVYDQESEGSGQAESGSRLPPKDNQQNKQHRPEKRHEQQGEGASQQPQPQPQAQTEGDGADQPAPLTPDEKDTLEVQWQQRMAGAAQQAMQAGKMGGQLARLIDHLLQPQLPWRTLLAHYLSTTARDDFSYMRPSRREGSAILPSLRSQQIDIALAIDTSGSISDQEVREFLAEVHSLKGQLRSRITLIPCDAHILEGAPWVFEPWEDFQLPDSLKGGGGTDFRPVFDWLDRQNFPPNLLVYFTDAQGRFPQHPPTYPVIWLVKGREKVPWGQRVQLN